MSFKIPVTIGTYFVIACGKDCDGYNRGEVKTFPCKEFAEISAENSNEWSDGIQYRVVGIDEVWQYCQDFWMNEGHYILEAFRKVNYMSKLIMGLNFNGVEYSVAELQEKFDIFYQEKTSKKVNQ
jgi:hypothetical protein